MTRDDILSIAYSVGTPGEPWWLDDLDLIAFASKVADIEAAKWAKGVKVNISGSALESERSAYHRLGFTAGVNTEREECAKLAAQTVCDTHLPTGVKIYGSRVAEAIRARSKS